MYQKLIQRLEEKPFSLLVVVLLLLVLKEIVYTSTFLNKSSPIADGYSEANAIRGATYFHDKGFQKTSGLPVLCYSDILPHDGIGSSNCNGAAYTHYPPGPEYLLWFWMNLFGKGTFNPIRYVNILLSFLVGFFFLKEIFQFVGGGKKGVLLGVMLILPPLYSNYMHGLHYQQPAFLILQLQIILSFRYLRDPRLFYIPAFFLLGFAQGWLSFDFAFLSTFFIVPFYFLRGDKSAAKFSNLLAVVFFSGLSFTLSHVLHFFQVASYAGGVDAALLDFKAAAAHRAYNASSAYSESNPKFSAEEIGYFTVAKDFLYRVAGRGKYLAINLINFIWIIFALRFIRKIETKKWTLHFSVTTKDILAVASAVVISCLWSLVMRQHAHIHGFIARHYYFCYFFCCLILVRNTTVSKNN